jgi:hypothetical protein
MGKRGKGRDKGKMPFFFPRFRIGEGGRGGLGRQQGGGAPGVSDGRGKGKMERGSRGSQPRAHLGLGLLVEAAPR